jgi:hypothetical protein
MRWRSPAIWVSTCRQLRPWSDRISWVGVSRLDGYALFQPAPRQRVFPFNDFPVASAAGFFQVRSNPRQVHMRVAMICDRNSSDIRY